MKKYDDEAASVRQEWTERETRAAFGATKPQNHDDKFDPKGPHRWFAEAIAEVAAILAMRRAAEAWRSRPPYPSWQSCAPAIRQKADEWTTSSQLPPGMTLAEWYKENERLLQQDPTQERIRVVAVALLPLFQQNRDSWEATDWLDIDTHGTFREYLKDWHARVPERLRLPRHEAGGI